MDHMRRPVGDKQNSMCKGVLGIHMVEGQDLVKQNTCDGTTVSTCCFQRVLNEERCVCEHFESHQPYYSTSHLTHEHSIVLKVDVIN